MRLSGLQKFILMQCYNSRNYRAKRERFLEFYENSRTAKKELQTKIITGSLESLIDKGLAIGYGRRTPEKWFIEELKLTIRGIKQVRNLLGQQLSLPIRK